MNDMHQIAPAHGASFDSSVAEAIALQTAVPLELATHVYRQELSALAREARITQYLHVIAGRRARLRLQKH